MEVVTYIVYRALSRLEILYILLERFALKKLPYVTETALGCHVINATMGVHASFIGKPKPYWLHSLVLVVLTGFGGGIIGPLLIGKPSFIMINDLIIPLCVMCWYSIHCLGLYNILNWKPVKIVWSLYLAILRAHSAMDVVNLSFTVLKPGPYYPVPLVGPVLCSTLTGCLGGFMPLDKGLLPIFKSTSWIVQSAFLSAAYYYFMIKDTTGIIGVTMRNVFGHQSERWVALTIIYLHMASIVLQIVFDPQANLFTPVHKLLYLVFQVQGPITTPEDAALIARKSTVGWEYSVRTRLEVFLDKMRWFIVLSIAVAYYAAKVPNSSIPAVDVISREGVDGHQSKVKSITHNGGSFDQLTLRSSIASTSWAELLPLPASMVHEALPDQFSYQLRLEEYRIYKDEDAEYRGAPVKHYFRLSMYKEVALSDPDGAVSELTVSEEKLHRSEYYWSCKIHVDALDSPHSETSLLLTKDGTLYISATTEHSATLSLQPSTVSLVMWHGRPAESCGEAAESLFIDRSDGLPRIRCSTGESVPLDGVGEVFYSLPASHQPPSPSISDVKGEL